MLGLSGWERGGGRNGVSQPSVRTPVSYAVRCQRGSDAFRAIPSGRDADTSFRAFLPYLCRCIKKWLRRGKSACPLCKWDARTLFDVDGQPQAEGVGADPERETAVDIESGEASADAR